jgi:hypothetical protein
MKTTDEEQEPFDWEQWPARRAEMKAAMKAMQDRVAALDPGPNLDNVRAATKKFVSDMENVISAGDAEYGRLHPGATFDSN